MDEWHIVEVDGKQVWRRVGDVRFVLYGRFIYNSKPGLWTRISTPSFKTVDEAFQLITSHDASQTWERKGNTTKFSKQFDHEYEYKAIKEGEDPNG